MSAMLLEPPQLRAFGVPRSISMRHIFAALRPSALVWLVNVSPAAGAAGKATGLRLTAAITAGRSIGLGRLENLRSRHGDAFPRANGRFPVAGASGGMERIVPAPPLPFGPWDWTKVGDPALTRPAACPAGVP